MQGEGSACREGGRWLDLLQHREGLEKVMVQTRGIGWAALLAWSPSSPKCCKIQLPSTFNLGKDPAGTRCHWPTAEVFPKRSCPPPPTSNKRTPSILRSKNTALYSTVRPSQRSPLAPPNKHHHQLNSQEPKADCQPTNS